MNKNHQVAYQVVDEINDVIIDYKFTIKEAVSSARDYLDTFLEDEYTQVSIIKYRNKKIDAQYCNGYIFKRKRPYLTL